jgi:hypothetical protein
MKIRPLGAELFHENGKTEKEIYIIKVIAAFRNFAKAPKTHFIFCNKAYADMGSNVHPTVQNLHTIPLHRFYFLSIFYVNCGIILTCNSIQKDIHK